MYGMEFSQLGVCMVWSFHNLGYVWYGVFAKDALFKAHLRREREQAAGRHVIRYDEDFLVRNKLFRSTSEMGKIVFGK